MKKKWWDDNGVEHMDVKLPTTQAGVQVSSGALLERGVTHIVHAVGPIWTDYKIEEKTFNIVSRKIKITVKRALNAVSRLGARSCALPSISGGMVYCTDVNNKFVNYTTRYIHTLPSGQ